MAAPTKTVTANSHLDLHVHRWPAPAGANAQPHIDANLLLIHGLGEHAGRYAQFAAGLNAHGIGVVAPDLPGHGKSPGARGDAPGFAAMVDSLEPAFASLDRTRPRFVLGHSFGGLLAVQLALRHVDLVKALLLSSPFFGFGTPPKPWQRFMARMLLKIVPGLGVPTGLDTGALARDPQVAIDYLADPLVHDRMSPRLFAEAELTHALMPALGVRLPMPVLVWHGDADRLTEFAASQRFASKLKNPKGAFIGVAGGYHELLNDQGHEALEQRVLEWLGGV
jgi:alpha-beta hydrolase superfamily lysophospholipase